MTEPDFRDIILKTFTSDLEDNVHQQLLAVFGSEENIEVYKDLFVIEQSQTTFTTVDGPDPMLTTYRAETEIRIRPKTLAELEADEKHG